MSTAATAAAAAHHYHFTLSFSCTGCSSAVDRVLSKTPGLTSHNVSFEDKTADVYTDSVSYEDVLGRIKGTGKEVKSGSADGVEKPI